jgi:hypothetical protein
MTKYGCEEMQFPTVTGNNLLKQEIQIPNQLGKEYNIVVIAFEQWHQLVVNSWVPFLEETVEKHPWLDYYELPTIRKMNPIYRHIVDSGMRGGIPSNETRRRTITLYIDKKSFRYSLDIPDESDIHLFLISRDGAVFWREQGEFTNEKAEGLLKTINEIAMEADQPSS